MNYGLYLSATGVLTNMHRQDVIANNLVNATTTAFKPDAVYTRQRLPARLDPGGVGVHADPRWMLERLGGGHWVQPTHIDFSQGALMGTGNDLDLAIRGDGFFVVSAGDGGGTDHLLLTRDGRLTRSDRNELVMAGTGLRVLDVNNRPIRLRSQGPLRINERGEIEQNGTTVARIQLATVGDLTRLTKAGANLYRFDSTPQPANGRIMQGQLESSAVDAITTLTALIGATKAVTGNAKMMQYHDFLIGLAVNTLGRVA